MDDEIDKIGFNDDDDDDRGDDADHDCDWC